MKNNSTYFLMVIIVLAFSITNAFATASSEFDKQNPECTYIGSIPIDHIKPDQVNCLYKYFVFATKLYENTDIDDMSRLAKVKHDNSKKSVTFIYELYNVRKDMDMNTSFKLVSILTKYLYCVDRRLRRTIFGNLTYRDLNAVMDLGISIDEEYYLDRKKLLSIHLDKSVCHDFAKNFTTLEDEYKKVKGK